MNEKRVYLDTSSIVKRYIEQRSSEVIDRVYEESEAGRIKTVFSVWNFGEALDVLAVDLVLAGAIFDARANHDQGRTYNTSTINQREKL